MFKIQLRTYNEALRFSRCLEVRKYAPKISDQIIGKMYNFLSENPAHKIGMSKDMLYFVNAQGMQAAAFAVATTEGFDRLEMSTAFFHVVNASTSSDSGCGGCASNNNNNNNNNNNA